MGKGGGPPLQINLPGGGGGGSQGSGEVWHGGTGAGRFIQDVIGGMMGAQQSGIQSIAQNLADSQQRALERMGELQMQNANPVNTLLGSITGMMNYLQNGVDLLC